MEIPVRKSGHALRPGQVSVIIPVHNREHMLAEAVESALGQTYRNIEVLIVDDGSVDATWLTAQAFSTAHPGIVHALRQENSGPGAARNLGETVARGEFIQYLDSDDLLEPRKLELQVSALNSHPEAGVAYGITQRVNVLTGASRTWARTSERITDIFPSFLMTRGWDTNSPLWRRSVCEAIGPWGDFRCMEDWEHDLRAGLLGVKAVQVTEHVATVRDHQETRSSGMNSGFTPALIRDLFRAHRSVWQRMQASGLNDWSYLRDFSRKVFWIARMCGEHDLISEADEALSMAQAMTATHHAAYEIRLFRMLTRLLGWPRAVKVSESVRRGSRRSGGHAFA
jgi:glycosyltransferase involved in cell wall biosynthesis